VNEPYVIEANYKKSFLVNVWTSYGSAVGGGFYDDGSVAEINMQKTQVVVDPNKVRKVFAGWETHGARIMNVESSDSSADEHLLLGNQNLLVLVNKPVNVTTNWKTQYHLNVISPEGKPSGEGWYDIGKVVNFGVSGRTTPPGIWTASTFDRWAGDTDSTKLRDRVIMNEPKTVIAEWREDNTP